MRERGFVRSFGFERSVIISLLVEARKIGW